MMQPDPEEDEVNEVEQEQAQEVPAGADKEKTEREKTEKETDQVESEQAKTEKAEKETSENQKADDEQAEEEKSSKDDGDQIMGGTDAVTAGKNDAKPTDDAQIARDPQESSKIKTEEDSELPIKKENDQDGDQPMPDPPNIQVNRSSTSENTSQPHTQPDRNTATIANSTQETVVKSDQPSTKNDSAHSSFDEDEVTSAANVQPGAGNLAKFMDEVDRGPLLPDHFREAVRRYRKARDGGTTGFTGLSLEGRENAAVRSGGRKLFR
jgi:transcription initiation factor TFIID subunit 11